MALLCLPSEVLLHIASFLEVPELVSCTYVSARFSLICRDYSLWKKFVGIQKTDSPPQGRLCHTGIVYNNSMYIFGGHTTQSGTEFFHTVKQDLCEYKFVTRKWSTVCEGEKRTEHTTVVYKDTMVVFGGYSGSAYENSVMLFDLKEKSWSQMVSNGSVPSLRSAHTAVLVENKMYVFGGWNGANCMNDLYELNLDTHTWTQIASQGDLPCARCSHGSAVISDGASHVLYVFGGYSLEKSTESPSRGYLNDLYEFHFDTMTWHETKTSGNAPSPRSRFRMVSHRDSLYIFAGWNSQCHFNNLYQYSSRTGKWEEKPTNFDKEGIGQFSMNVYNDVMYVFSGFSPSTGCQSSLYAYPLMAVDRQAW